jgi:hypothetical protein
MALPWALGDSLSTAWRARTQVGRRADRKRSARHLSLRARWRGRLHEELIYVPHAGRRDRQPDQGRATAPAGVPGAADRLDAGAEASGAWNHSRPKGELKTAGP